MFGCSRADSQGTSSFFFNSTSHTCSKSEVITTFVLGTLALAMASAALYGYLADPTWLVGAHVLTGGTFLTGIVLGILVLTKCIKSCRHDRREGSAPLRGQVEPPSHQAQQNGHVTSEPLPNVFKGVSEPTIAPLGTGERYTPRKTAFREIFGKDAEDEAESLVYRIENTKSLQAWLITYKEAYAVARDAEGKLFALIACQHKLGTNATILISPDENDIERFTISYLYMEKKFPEINFADTSKFGNTKDVKFLKELVAGQAGDYTLWRRPING